jgi:O-acetyl-ADP-ribose deacetylase (regulator of RNase III)
VAQPVNAYLSFRAALRAVERYNQQRPGSIKAVACPGIGTGVGEMPVGLCAKQMRAAWDEVLGGLPFQPSGVTVAVGPFPWFAATRS